MNFLAHLYLSHGNEHVMVGNFIADFIHRGNYAAYDAEILNGVYLHHAIDRFTDTHEVVKQSAKRLKPEFGRYSTVIVDVLYDHFLAVEWSLYSTQELPLFADYAYVTLSKYTHLLPDSVVGFLPSMTTQNWLVNYGTFYGMERSLAGLSRRATFMSGFENALHSLQDHYETYRYEFNAFFPDVIAMSKTFLEEPTRPSYSEHSS